VSYRSDVVRAAVKDLFSVFGGMEFDSMVIEGIVNKMLDYRL
jgi:hypothetical protein